MKVWLYWEDIGGRATPEYIKLCREAILKHTADSFDGVEIVNERNVYGFLPNLRKDLNEIRRPQVKAYSDSVSIKSAYIRSRLIYEYGGIWLDSDMIPIRSFKPVRDLLENREFIGYHKTKYESYIFIGFYGAPKGSAVIKEYVDAQESVVSRRKVLKWGEIGAHMLTPIVRKNINKCYLFKGKSFQPLAYQEWKTFFSNLDPDKFIDNSTLCFTLYNNLFPDDFRFWSRDRILNEDILISKLLRKSLGI